MKINFNYDFSYTRNCRGSVGTCPASLSQGTVSCFLLPSFWRMENESSIYWKCCSCWIPKGKFLWHRDPSNDFICFQPRLWSSKLIINSFFGMLCYLFPVNDGWFWGHWKLCRVGLQMRWKIRSGNWKFPAAEPRRCCLSSLWGFS